MYRSAPHFSCSPVTFSGGAVACLALVYMTLIAVVMSYVALTIEFSQSVRNDEATVSALESQYLSRVAHLTATDVAAAGYAKPSSEIYVPAESVTALR